MTERQRFDVLQRFAEFELRRYPAHLVAEVDVEGSFESAANQAFGMLAGFISGRNRAGEKVAMTAPVIQQEAPARIAMTAPVVQTPGTTAGHHVVGFVMPAQFSLDTLPVPSDPRVRIREVPPRVAAVRAFTGRWSEPIYRRQLEELRSAVERAGLEITGAAQYDRFNPPWTPWFLRHNEVVLPVAEPGAASPRP